jgi:ATP-dependent protease ClpP protease subunit
MTELKEIQPLLETHRVLLLPADLDDAAYKDMAWALVAGRELFPNKRLKLWCHGNGGEATVGLALADLIQADGRIDGILVGGAFSGHSFIWAACSRRFCYPHAGIGVHTCVSSSNSWEDTSYRKTDVKRMEGWDRQIARFYAHASNKTVGWWLGKMNTGHSACHWLGAEKLVQLGMCSLIDKKG